MSRKKICRKIHLFPGILPFPLTLSSWFPVPCHTPRLRSSRASKTHKACGWRRKRVETRGRREILSRATPRRRALGFAVPSGKTLTPSVLTRAKFKDLCFSVSLSFWEIPHHNPVYFAVSKVTTTLLSPPSRRAYHFSNFHFLHLPQRDETPRDR